MPELRRAQEEGLGGGSFLWEVALAGTPSGISLFCPLSWMLGLLPRRGRLGAPSPNLQGWHGFQTGISFPREITELAGARREGGG